MSKEKVNILSPFNFIKYQAVVVKIPYSKAYNNSNKVFTAHKNDPAKSTKSRRNDFMPKLGIFRTVSGYGSVYFYREMFEELGTVKTVKNRVTQN